MTDTTLDTSWTLQLDRDGTETVVIICDTRGEELARGPNFRLPHGNDPVPPALAAMRLMATAPKLYRALDYLLEQTVDMDRKHGIALTEGEADARSEARSAIAEAAGARPEPRKLFLVEVAVRTRDVYRVEAATDRMPGTIGGPVN